MSYDTMHVHAALSRQEEARVRYAGALAQQHDANVAYLLGLGQTGPAGTMPNRALPLPLP